MLRALTLFHADPLSGEASDDASKRLFSLAPKRLLAVADPRPVPVTDYFQRLAYWLHQPVPTPVAPVTAAMDLADFDPQAFWLRLDPVHLVPDRDTLVLFPAADVGMTEEEALTLIEAFNHHFQADGIQLEYGAVDRWYVRMPQTVDIRSVPLPQAVGANLHTVQPQGSAVRYWNRLINEAQMLFFQHPLNQARREQGLPEINGLWLWGEGRLPEFVCRKGLCIVDPLEDPFLRALAGLIEADYRTEAVSDFKQIEAEALFVRLDKGAEVSWDQVEALLRKKQVNEVLLDWGGEHAWYWQPGYLRRFWRRWFNSL